jgi:hypothetical protein
MRLKQPQNGTRMNLNPTSKNKKNKTREKHMKGGHLQRKNNLVSLGSEAKSKVNTLNMPREGA